MRIIMRGHAGPAVACVCMNYDCGMGAGVVEVLQSVMDGDTRISFSVNVMA